MLRFSILSLLTLAIFSPAQAAPKYTVKAIDGGLEVKVDGKLLTRYLVKSGAKPILWPVIGPTGAEMTRGYPMRKAGPMEKSDHVHHRSFWFTHGDVNGYDFWAENTTGKPSNRYGTIAHREFLSSKGGKTAVIKTRNEWLDPQGKAILEDIRTLTFGSSDSGGRWIDYDSKLKALDSTVKFGDTKEGSFGVRVAGSMRVELKNGGRIITSEGDKDSKAWGARAAWVDYQGPVQGKKVGVAILNHPSSFRHPTYWHVRNYGLFAANSFGLHHFKRNKELDGSHTMKKGESIEFHFRVVFHEGDERQAGIGKMYGDYAKQKR